ncbi:Fur family transcriptional regulator [Cerasicoccus fimbriatus]|uniref:Fur family transcriptional regulator n=1 Tax=Cerasicoccus fimbriatus TaxID=3014554 RepID=UPI0022B53EB7|nr:transcriptional repressor [Cerasicoccus sp. TK19100]
MGKNFRDTKQRAAILNTLKNAEHPLTPKEIQERAAESAPGLGIATVYRNIRLLLDNNEIEPIEVPGHRTCYMLPGNGHRTLVVCRDTNRVVLADGVDFKIQPDNLPEGFQAEQVEIFIYGRYAT